MRAAVGSLGPESAFLQVPTSPTQHHLRCTCPGTHLLAVLLLVVNVEKRFLRTLSSCCVRVRNLQCLSAAALRMWGTLEM